MAGKKRNRDKISFRGRLLGELAAALIRLMSLTYRWELVEPAGGLDKMLKENPPGTHIWVFWHNRVFALPSTYKRYFNRRPAVVLTSASKDGEIIAATMASFGMLAVRGSSSRRGASALLSLADRIRNGYEAAVTPDGPRGPRYHLAPGVIKLAQITGAAILPIRLDASSVWTFKSWDRFQVPKPFARVRMTIEPRQIIDPKLDGEAFERERERIESILNPNNETD